MWEESNVNFKTNFPEAHDGRRVKKSNGRTYWFSSVTGNLLVETDGSGTVLNQYIYFGGRRVARKDGSGDVTYYFEEPAGRTRTMTGATGVACNEADYYLFGGEQSHGNTCDQNYHFAGMYRDGETGNDYTQFRMYESNLGRWMTPDPLAGDITNPQSLNRYAYVINNPTNLIDPLGLQGCHQYDDCPRPDDANTVDLSPLIDLINHSPSPGSSQEPRGPGGAGGGAPPAPTWFKLPPVPWELWEPLACSDVFTLDDQPYDVTGDFMEPRPRGPHLGMDFSAPAGTPIRVSFQGEVIRSGPAGGFGQIVVVQKTLEPVPGVQVPLQYSFGHGEANVRAGQTVRPGSEVMEVGSLGTSSGPHVDVRKSSGSVIGGPWLKPCTPQ
jgi:RHS repeat-associated protein